LRGDRPSAPSQAEVPSFPGQNAGQSPIGFHRLIQRVGEAAKMPFPIHPHMLRHACGFKLANVVTIRGPCSTTSGTRTFSTRSGTPTWRQTGSRTFGGTDDGGTRTRSWPTVREIGVICMSRRIGAPRRSHNRCAPRHACRRGDKSCDHVRGRPFLVLLTRGPIAVSASIISRFG